MVLISCMYNFQIPKSTLYTEHGRQELGHLQPGMDHCTTFGEHYSSIFLDDNVSQTWSEYLSFVVQYPIGCNASKILKKVVMLVATETLNGLHHTSFLTKHQAPQYIPIIMCSSQSITHTIKHYAFCFIGKPDAHHQEVGGILSKFMDHLAHARSQPIKWHTGIFNAVYYFMWWIHQVMHTFFKLCFIGKIEAHH